ARVSGFSTQSKVLVAAAPPVRPCIFVVLAPDDWRRRMILAEIGLNGGVEWEVGGIVVNDIELEGPPAVPTIAGGPTYRQRRLLESLHSTCATATLSAQTPGRRALDRNRP